MDMQDGEIPSWMAGRDFRWSFTHQRCRVSRSVDLSHAAQGGDETERHEQENGHDNSRSPDPFVNDGEPAVAVPGGQALVLQLDVGSNQSNERNAWQPEAQPHKPDGETSGKGVHERQAVAHGIGDPGLE